MCVEWIYMEKHPYLKRLFVSLKGPRWIWAKLYMPIQFEVHFMDDFGLTL